MLSAIRGKSVRIAINTLSLNKTKAGMGNYISNLVNSIASKDKGNEYYIFVSEKNKGFFSINQKNFKIVNLGSMITNRFIRLMWEQIFLPIYLKKHKIDLLHSPGFVIPLFSKTKNIVTIADMTFLNYPSVHTLLKRIYFRIFMPLSIKKADKVISISESTKKDALRLLNVEPGKIEVIHLAYGKGFKEINKKRAEESLRKEYGVQPPFILFVGMIEPRKNLTRIFKAYSHLKKNGEISHKFVVVGKKGWKYRKIFNAIEKFGMKNEVIFAGYVPNDDLVKFYNAADVLVYPCLYEGFGLPILEAMACGCPVITSNVSSMPEVAGDAALLVDPKDAKEIENAIKRVLADGALRKKMVMKGKINVKRFSWEETAQKTIEIYKQL